MNRIRPALSAATAASLQRRLLLPPHAPPRRADQPQVLDHGLVRGQPGLGAGRVEIDHRGRRQIGTLRAERQRALVLPGPAGVVHVAGRVRVADVGQPIVAVHPQVDGDGQLAIAAPGGGRPRLAIARRRHHRLQRRRLRIDAHDVHAAVDLTGGLRRLADRRVFDPALQRLPRRGRGGRSNRHEQRQQKRCQHPFTVTRIRGRSRASCSSPPRRSPVRTRTPPRRTSD